MTITREADGRVIIRDPATGRTETIVTAVLDRPANAKVAEAVTLPSHQWTRA